MTVPTLINAYLCAVMMQEITAFSLIMASFPHWIALTVWPKSTLARVLIGHRRASHLLAVVFFLQAFSTPDTRDPRQYHVYNRLFFSGFTLLLAYLGTRVEAEKYCELYLAKKRMLDAMKVTQVEQHDTSTKAVEQELVHADLDVKLERMMQDPGHVEVLTMVGTTCDVYKSAAEAEEEDAINPDEDETTAFVD